MKRIQNIGLWVALLLLASCTKEMVDGTQSTDGVEVALSLDGMSASRAATGADENYIGPVQLFVFPATADGSGVAERILNMDDQKGTTDDMLITWNHKTKTFIFRGIKGNKTLYVVANGTAANGYTPTFTQGVTKESDVEAVVTARKGEIAAPVAGVSGFLMAGSVDVDFSADLFAKIDLPLVRQVAKIDLKVFFDPSFSNAQPGVNFGEADFPATFTTYNIPTQAYVGSSMTALPAGTTMTDYKLANLTPVSGQVREWSSQLYVYPNPQAGATAADKKLATQFVISIPYTYTNGTLVHANTYLVYITDSRLSEAASPHKVLRNQNYKVNVRVRGFGSVVPAVDRTSVTTEILPWNVNESDHPVGEFIKLSASSVDLLAIDESMTVTYQDGDPEVTLEGDAVGKIIITKTPNAKIAHSGTLTFDRADVLHDGKKYTGTVKIKMLGSTHTVELPVSIEQYSVNVGGTLKTSDDGSKKYWSGGTNWATGNLVINDWPAFRGMSVSTNPDEKGIFFKWLSEWGGDQPAGPFSDGSGRPDSAPGFNIWTDLGQSGSQTNGSRGGYYDPCRHAARIPGQSGGIQGLDTPPSQGREIMYWRTPTLADIQALRDTPNQNIVGIKRTFLNGRLLVCDNGSLDENGVHSNVDNGGFNIDFGSYDAGTGETSCVYMPSINRLAFLNKKLGYNARCVVDDNPRITGSNGAEIKTIHVAKRDIECPTWAEAMGLADIYNDELAPAPAPPLDLHAFMGYAFSGCRQFGAEWRVPTSQEMQNTVWTQREEIVAQGGDPIQLASYATGSQSSATDRYNYDTRHPNLPGGWGPFITTKRTKVLVRCVKSTHERF